jgi:hypothetical protein
MKNLILIACILLSLNKSDAQILACATTPNGDWIAGVSFNITGSGNNIPVFNLIALGNNNNGCASINSIPVSSNSNITPSKDDNPLSGVSTYDLVLISKHILGLSPIANPYYILAADANHNGSVTTFDIVELRKLILGIYTTLPNSTAWRFVPKSYVFPNPANPFANTVPEQIGPITQSTVPEFIGIKVGDVNGSVIAHFTGEGEVKSRTQQEAALVIPDLVLEAGAIMDVPVSVATPTEWLGFQCAFEWDRDAIRLEGLQEGSLPLDPAEHLSTTPDGLSVSWSDAYPHPVSPEQQLFSLRLHVLKTTRLRDVLRLSDRFMPESYPAHERDAIHHLVLQYQPAADLHWTPVPNPTVSAAAIPIFLESASPVRLVLYDATGKIQYESTVQLESGHSTLQIPASAMPVKGMYAWRVEVGYICESGVLVKM